MDKITTHIPDAVGRLIEAFKGAPNITKLVEVIGASAQREEDGLWTVQIDLANAQGFQLDLLGMITGTPREGRTDNQYRREIPVQRHYSGTPNQLIDLIRLLTGDSDGVVSVETVQPFVSRIGTADPVDEVRFQIVDSTMAGIELYLSQGNGGHPFSLIELGDDPAELPEDIRGLDDGHLNELLLGVGHGG